MTKIIDKKFLPAVRWDILRTCRIAGHIGTSENILREVIRSEWVAVTQKVVRDELHYLEQRRLIEVQRSEISAWIVKLTRHGYDVVDYQVDCEEGIRRPSPIDE